MDRCEPVKSELQTSDVIDILLNTNARGEPRITLMTKMLALFFYPDKSDALKIVQWLCRVFQLDDYDIFPPEGA